MKLKKVVIAGGNGYLGRVLSAYYGDQAEEVVILSRTFVPASGNTRTCVWDGRTEGSWCFELEGADLLINLCGRNVNCRYTPRNRREILLSRTVPTALLGQVIGKLSQPPRTWVTTTSATIYRNATDRLQDEDIGEFGSGFSVDVCKEWERAFFACETPNTRKIALRTSFVLGATGSAFPRLLKMARLGFGGPQGQGKQYVSWIHEQDFARVVDWVASRRLPERIFNCTAPEPVSNREFMHTIRAAARIPFGLPAPEWLLIVGALLIGTEPELVLKSRFVAPKRLLDSGFVFRFPTAQSAINDLIKPVPCLTSVLKHA